MSSFITRLRLSVNYLWCVIMATRTSFHWPALMSAEGACPRPSALFVSSHLDLSLSAWSSETVNEAAGGGSESCSGTLQQDRQLLTEFHLTDSGNSVFNASHSFRDSHVHSHTMQGIQFDMQTGGAGDWTNLVINDDPLYLLATAVTLNTETFVQFGQFVLKCPGPDFIKWLRAGSQS